MTDSDALAWLDKLRTSSAADHTRDLQRLLNADAETHTGGSDAILAGYRLLREIGRGGMSLVWLAERADGVPKRLIALKLPLFALTSAVEIERMKHERDVLAALEHPHIARLYDAGVTESGQPFMALEYVDGIPITMYCDQHRLSLRDRLRLFQQVLAAVAHAHTHLVVHRDLKPSNVPVDAHGQVKLLDFGIAKLMTSAGPAATAASEMTRVGGFVLTPRYAAPEQLKGESISTVTDVYLLGLLLYELLTGLLPHVTDASAQPTVERMYELLVNEDAVRPSRAPMTPAAAEARGLTSVARLCGELSGDLDTIVLKALRIQPAERYVSVERMAEDIRRFLAQEPIAARSPSPWYVMRLYFRRKRAVAVALGVGLLAAVALSTVAWRQYREAQDNATRTTIVRNFMFDLVNDAEPDETHPELEVTGKQMVHGAVRRARLEFGNQPRLRGELLGELGRMYTRLGEPESAQPVLTEALGLLEQHAPADDAALNKARAHLADLLFAEGDMERASSLANLATRSCTQSDEECPKARAYGYLVLSKVAMHGGQAEEALDAMRRSVADTALGFGADDAETATANVSLAVVARNVGRLQEAGAAVTKAAAIAEHQTLSAADRLLLVRTQALLDIDLGHYTSARQRLNALLEKSRDADERALQLRLLANTLLLQGEATEALRVADAGIGEATAAENDAEILFLTQAHARALALLARHDEARAEIATVIEGFRKLGRSEKSLAVVRARRAQAEALARAGELDAAVAELQPLSELELEQADALDLLACVLRIRGSPAEALDMHRRARALYEKNLPPEHPFLLRNTLYIDASGNDRDAFVQAAERVKRQFGATSVWRTLIESCEKGSSCLLIL